ncbi:Crp/Fnr family transcriptional regulator [Tabrizicola sp. YIM 78059]|uniref:Crp/Fnr family transcriptional regulator n=1 Tax=Tabrizicola sp. YIM 78059 TaxID=2529861 RepID=UPI0010A9E680|nr:Crp/Fnr family transcriptional regulator [Tabrizicola sp. YIM 78059]
MTWIDRFDGLRALPAEIADALVSGSNVVSLPAGARVFEAGQHADNLLLLLGGTVRVQQRSESGREVFLYRVHAGESCVLTTACMLANEDYSAEGITETEVEAVVIPRRVFEDLAGRSDRFRSFIFRAYSRRIADLFALIHDIVFQRVDVRLAARLLSLARGDEVRATHQALSVELGTAREVVSRTLGDFQRRGWVEQSRGLIRVLNREALDRHARSVT